MQTPKRALLLLFMFKIKMATEISCSRNSEAPVRALLSGDARWHHDVNAREVDLLVVVDGATHWRPLLYRRFLSQ